MHSIGRYRLVRRIGAGSFATVWLGHDDDLDVPVAVKVLADNWASNGDVRSRFLAEGWLPTAIDARRTPCYWPTRCRRSPNRWTQLASQARHRTEA